MLKANRTFLRWTGYTLDQLLEVRFVDLLLPGAKIFHETHYLPLLHLNGHVEELSLEMRRQDGSRLPALVNAVMDRSDEGVPMVVRIAVFDATERRRYEQEILDARRRAEASEARATQLARTLQETLMPPRSPQIPGLDLATAFRPAGTGAEIGGDFYDVFELADQDWVITIGDVSGKGVEAAVVATLARHTIRALSVSETSPAAVLVHLNQVLHGHPSGRFCTVAVLRLRRVEDSWDVTLSLGGHPSPLLMEKSRAPREISEPSYLVGAFDFATYDDVRFELRPGMTLLLHTDGVTEARRDGDIYGEDRLRRLLHDNVDRPEALLGGLLAAVLDFQGGNPKDDIALVALRVPDEHRLR
ncbi:MAG: rsbP 3 [Marmoricola sp.]|nr:rsbP 3 [Marmoricola sp.]